MLDKQAWIVLLISDTILAIVVEDWKMSQQNEVVLETAGREIVSSRLINAPQEKVFEAFRNPDILVRWWGPEGRRLAAIWPWGLPPEGW